MTFSSRSLILPFLLLAGCVAAKDPLAGGDQATFGIIPDRLKATAELSRADGDSFGKARTQILHFDVCLQSLVTGQNVAAGSEFTIIDGAAHGLNRRADNAGCVHWDEEHAVNPLAPERNVRVDRRIKANGNHRGTVTLAFNVKPWLIGPDAVSSALNNQKFVDAITVGSSLDFGDGYPVGTAGAGAATVDSNTHFELAENLLEMSYVEVGRSEDFEVDPYMNLTVPYRYTFSFAPRIVRQVFSGALTSEPMTSGKLRVTFVFFASTGGDFKDDARYLTSVQVDATVGANGRVVGTVRPKYPHMLFASGRMTAMVQISAPARPEVAGHSFSGSMSIIDHQGPITMLDDGRDAERIHTNRTRERIFRARARPTPFTQFLSTFTGHRLNLNDLPPERARTDGSLVPYAAEHLISREEMAFALGRDGLDSTAFSTTPSLGLTERLCQSFLRAHSNLNYLYTISDFKKDYPTSLKSKISSLDLYYCADKAPGRDAVRIQHVSFIEKLVSPVPRKVLIRTYSNQDFGVFYGRDTADSTVTGFGIHLPDFMNMKFMDAFIQSVNTNTLSQRGSFGQTQTMAVDTGYLEVNAVVRDCLIVTAVNQPFSATPWLMCADQPRPAEWVKDNFYYYSQMFGANHSPFIDPYNPQAGIKMLVRGKPHMKRLTRTLQGTDFRDRGFDVFIQGRIPNLNDFDTTGPLDVLTDQSVPGAIER